MTISKGIAVCSLLLSTLGFLATAFYVRPNHEINCLVLEEGVLSKYEGEYINNDVCVLKLMVENCTTASMIMDHDYPDLTLKNIFTEVDTEIFSTYSNRGSCWLYTEKNLGFDGSLEQLKKLISLCAPEFHPRHRTLECQASIFETLENNYYGPGKAIDLTKLEDLKFGTTSTSVTITTTTESITTTTALPTKTSTNEPITSTTLVLSTSTTTDSAPSTTEVPTQKTTDAQAPSTTATKLSSTTHTVPTSEKPVEISTSTTKSTTTIPSTATTTVPAPSSSDVPIRITTTKPARKTTIDNVTEQSTTMESIVGSAIAPGIMATALFVLLTSML